jgi:outer membrane protein assembly factor BamB
MALDLQSKKLLWEYTPKDRQFPFYASAAIADGKVVPGGRDTMVHALEAKTGKPLWTFTTRARVESPPAIAGGRVFVGSNDGRVYGLDLASGKKVWEYEAASLVTSSPAVAKGKVVVATADGQVICFGSRQTPTVDSLFPKGGNFPLP